MISTPIWIYGKLPQPYLERWMSEQLGWRGLVRHLREEAPNWATLLPQFPRLLHHALNENRAAELEQKMAELLAEEKRQSRWLVVISLLLTAVFAWQFLG